MSRVDAHGERESTRPVASAAPAASVPLRCGRHGAAAHGRRMACAAAAAGTVLVLAAGVVSPANAQRAQPRTAFTAADFGRLRWLEGAWQGSAEGERTFYERYHIRDDSTIVITAFGDGGLTRAVGHGRLYLVRGRIYHSFGPARWVATQVSDQGAYFIPLAGAGGALTWSVQSADAWTATLRTGLGGHERETVYRMRRLPARR